MRTINLLLDIEANGLDPDKIHCICTKEFREKGSEKTFTNTNAFYGYLLHLHKRDIVPKFFIHNGLNYDVPVLNRLIFEDFLETKDIVDTMVVSKTVNYKRFRTHSLKEIGEHLGVYKGDYDGGWDVCTPEMVEYCEQDVEVLEAVVEMLWDDMVNPANTKALRVEHDMAAVCYNMSQAGFLFNTDKAEGLLEEVNKDKKDLEDSFNVVFPPKLTEIKRLKLRYTKDGSLFSNIIKAQEEYPKVEIEDGEVIVYDYTEFNPASPKERIEALWEAGWNPVEKTDGHKKKLKETRGGSKTWR